MMMIIWLPVVVDAVEVVLPVVGGAVGGVVTASLDVEEVEDIALVVEVSTAPTSDVVVMVDDAASNVVDMTFNIEVEVDMSANVVIAVAVLKGTLTLEEYALDTDVVSMGLIEEVVSMGLIEEVLLVEVTVEVLLMEVTVEVLLMEVIAEGEEDEVRMAG